MMRLGPAAAAVVALVIGVQLFGGGLASNALAAAVPDKSEVALVFDFSASILQDEANRNRFGAALEGIAARVDETSRDLIGGDATVSLIQFASTAIDYQGCTEIKLLGSPRAVGRFAECLRSVAGAYRRGLDPALTRSIGKDTNYVAAMEQAAKHLPADAVRPTLILFSDGKHDVAGVPIGQVAPARDRLFGSRSPFALLPVGMGLDPKERKALETGLVRLRIIRAMPPCVSGTPFDWPLVVFESPEEAGNAVAVALQDATCTFTVAPTPTPALKPGAVHGIEITAGDGRIELTWSPPAATAVRIVDYRARCRAGTEDWIESTEGVTIDPSATVEGLVNGTAYQCEVAAVGASSEGEWTTAATTVTPIARPAAPGKPGVEALDRALRISVPPDDGAGATGYHFECSSDNGGTWPGEVDVASPDTTTGQVDNLTNGVEYVCRAFAVNATGLSDASPVSDAVKPCGSLLECNSLLPPILGILGVVLAGGLVMVLVALYRDRSRGYVVAVVDVVHTANLGHGSNLGIAFVRAPGSRTVTGIVAERGPKADMRIRNLRGGRFVVTDRAGRHTTSSGEPIIAVDSIGVRHELVLRAFATRAASSVTSRR
jgi:hypothetical protein